MALASIWEEAHHLGQAGASTVGLMVTGHETARLGTGRTDVTDVGTEGTLREIAKTAQRA